jgi:hypothetical protein
MLKEHNMYTNTPRYEGHVYTEGKGYDLSIPIPVLGRTTDEDGFDWPIFPNTTPEYQAQLDAMNNRSRSAWQLATDRFTAEDLDRRCTEVHEANQRS